LATGLRYVCFYCGSERLLNSAQVSKSRVRRFENAFGKVNTKFEAAGHVIGIVNSMNIDASADRVRHAMLQPCIHSIRPYTHSSSLSQALQSETWAHLRDLANETEQGKRVLLFLHVPLHKDEGHCVDSPMIRYSYHQFPCRLTSKLHTDRDSGGFVAQQNMLSPASSDWILSRLRPKFIFDGHDHYGCVYTHDFGIQEYWFLLLVIVLFPLLLLLLLHHPTSPFLFNYFQVHHSFYDGRLRWLRSNI
jgi:hypothetical protein